MSQVATYRDKRQVVAKPYAPGGCPIHVGKQKCGETQGLDIILDFHKMYEDKMNEIDLSAGGDSLQEKVDLQEQWISDLTEQNRLLARVIEELESETIGKVQQLEDKLNNAVKSFGEEDNRPLVEKEKKKEEAKEDLKSLPAVEEDSSKKKEEIDRLKQGHQLKRHEEKLPVIVEVNEQEISSNECIRDEQLENQLDDTKDPFHKFMEEIQTESTPIRRDNKQLPKCKDFCYMLKLSSEITTLKLQIHLKDELLLQQLKIIKVLATKLFVMESLVKKTGKTFEDIMAEEILSRIF